MRLARKSQKVKQRRKAAKKRIRAMARHLSVPGSQRSFSTKNSFGAEITGIDVRSCTPDIIRNLAFQVRKCGVVIVRDPFQGRYPISAMRQAEITRWLSPSGRVYKNKANFDTDTQQLPEIFRVSNDATQGIIGAGSGVWHHDALHLQNVAPFAVYHVPMGPGWDSGDSERIRAQGVRGATWFARADTSKVPAGVRDQLRQLQSMFRPSGFARPLLHEETNTFLPPADKEVAFVEKDGTFIRRLGDAEKEQLRLSYHELLLRGELTHPLFDSSKDISRAEVDERIREMEKEVLAARSHSAAAVYRHIWCPGDLVILDNTRVAHRAPTREDIAQLDTRILHRSVAI